MKVPFLDLARGYAAFASEIDRQMSEVAASGSYVLGTRVSALEASIAARLGTRHAVGVASGTDALHLALKGLGIGPGDEVITTPFTFAATVEAIEYVGAQPVLVDIDPHDCNIDADLLEAALTPATRAIIPVHLFGYPADMRRIMDVANNRGITVIEDCAQSFGARFDDQFVGSIGQAGAFSFYPTKILGGLGDGGLISINDSDLDGRLRTLRNHGIAGGEHVTLGFNSRLDELQAAILDLRLANIDKAIARRRQIAAYYDAALAESRARVPPSTPGRYHVYGYYTIQVENRDTLRAKLTERDIGTAVYYARPLHRYDHFGDTCRFGSLIHAERAAECSLSLSIFPELTDDEVDYVASTVAALLR